MAAEGHTRGQMEKEGDKGRQRGERATEGGRGVHGVTKGDSGGQRGSEREEMWRREHYFGTILHNVGMFLT